jgi:hypothetical protein
MKKNRLLVAGLVSIILIAVFLIPTKIPYNISTAGVVMPVKEWSLSRTQGGDLVSTLKDNRTGKLSAFSISVFQRGNEARFQLNPIVYHLPYLREGDTIATMYSNKDEERLVNLQGDLEVQHSELRFHNSGQKTYDVEAIANRIAVAKQELETQRSITTRTEALYKDSLISRQQYELALNLLRVRELDVKTAEANYASAKSGGKPEQIQLVQARINAIEQQIEQIRNGMKNQTLIAPIGGAVIHKKAPIAQSSEDLLLSIADTSAFVVVLPVEYIEKEYVEPGQEVEMAIQGTTHIATGKIISIDNTVQIVDGRQALFVTAVCDEKNLPLVPGMILKTNVLCQPITISQYAARIVGLFFVH